VKLRLRNLVPGTVLVGCGTKCHRTKLLLKDNGEQHPRGPMRFKRKKDATTGVSATGESARGQSDDTLSI
jgi:hypothetical protein